MEKFGDPENEVRPHCSRVQLYGIGNRALAGNPCIVLHSLSIEGTALLDEMSFPGLTVLKPELDTAVKDIFRGAWSERDGEVVPEPEDLKLGNDAVKLDATALYADISSSTDLVDSYESQFAAEIYKAFLICAAKIIKDEEGVITAYDGDPCGKNRVEDQRRCVAYREPGSQDAVSDVAL